MEELLQKLSVRMCEELDCDNCPVVTQQWEKRTNTEKCLEHKPCCSNLEHWLKYISMN